MSFWNIDNIQHGTGRKDDRAAKVKADKLRKKQAAEKAAAEFAKLKANPDAKLEANPDAKLKADQAAAKLKADQAAAKLKADQVAAKLKADQDAAKLKENRAAKIKEDKLRKKQAAEKAAAEFAKLKADQDAAKLKADQDAAKLKADQDAAKLKADQYAKIKAAQAAAKLKADQDAKIKAEQDAKIKAAQAAKIKAAQAAAKLKAEQDAKIKAAQAAAKLKAEQDAKIKAAQAAAKLKVDQDAKIKAAQAAAKLKVDQDAKIKAAQAAAKLKAEQDAKIKAEQVAAKLKEKKAAIIKAEKLKKKQAADKAAAEFAKLKADQAAAKLKAQAAKKPDVEILKLPEISEYCYKNIVNIHKYNIDILAYRTEKEKIGSVTREYTLFISKRYPKYLFYKTIDRHKDGSSRNEEYRYRIPVEPIDEKNYIFDQKNLIDFENMNLIFNMGPPPMGEPKIKKCLSIDPPVVIKKPPIVEDSDNTLKLMSYNVDFKNESKSAFKNRLNIVNIIARENPDIIGLQEAKWFNRSNEPLKSMNILKNMGGFAIKNDGGDPNYTSMVLFNQNKFILVSQLDKNLHNRGVNVVKLEHIKTKKHIIVINAHLDHMWNGANFKGINEIRKTIKLLYNATEEIKYNKGDHIIFMGDTNEFYEEFTNVKKYDFPIKLDNNIKFWMVNAGKTCCRNNPKGTLDYKSDVFGTNNQNLLTTLDSGKRLGEWGTSGSNPLSDHTWITAKYNLDGVIADVDDMDEKEVWAYDFDGVIHKLMKPGEDFKTNHRNPDHSKLSSNFVKDYKYLIPYLFKHTIDDIKEGISKGIKIKIVSANGERYTKPIFDLLKSQGINLRQTHYK
jgi:hypothetical protein